MGNKVRRSALVILALLLVFPYTVYADSASDLYKKYDMKYEQKYPTNVLSTIAKYQNAKKYVYMYQYVIESEYDTSIIENRIKTFEKELKDTEKKLLDGYDKSISDIYELEEKYSNAKAKLADAKKSLKNCKVDYKPPKSKDVPSYAEYSEACMTKSLVDNQNELGNISDMKYPTETACLIADQTKTSMTFETANNTIVQSVFNGKIISVSDDNEVTISHHNKIYSHYKGLNSVVVSVGDEVKQGQVIGTSSSQFTLQLKVGGKLVDVSKLFKEDNNE